METTKDFPDGLNEKSTSSDDKEKDAEKEVAQEQRVGDQEEDVLGGPVFTPRLYIQRYLMVLNLLKEENVTSVVDFGCAECNMIRYLKTLDHVGRIVCVDIDEPLLLNNRFKAKPLIGDYLQPRDNPLSVEIYHGSMAEFDSMISNIESCLLVEIIEHLEPDVLEKFPENVFGRLSPSLVIVTTPNAEYNVLFPNFTGMRHWDHKFEWSQQQFQDWCFCICDKYGYSVTYTGVGDPPEDRKELGFCSQIAVFKKKPFDTAQYNTMDSKSALKNSSGNGNKLSIFSEKFLDDSERPYRLIEAFEHPYKKIKLSEEEALQIEISYYCNILAADVENNDDEPDIRHVQLKDLLNFQRISNLCKSIEELRDHVAKSEFSLSKDKDCVIVPYEDKGSSRWYNEDQEEDIYYDTEENKNGNKNVFEKSEWHTNSDDVWDTELSKTDDNDWDLDVTKGNSDDDWDTVSEECSAEGSSDGCSVDGPNSEELKKSRNDILHKCWQFCDADCDSANLCMVANKNKCVFERNGDTSDSVNREPPAEDSGINWRDLMNIVSLDVHSAEQNQFSDAED